MVSSTREISAPFSRRMWPARMAISMISCLSPAADSSFGSGALFSSSFIVLLFPAAYGLHRPQGLYPCSSSSSLVPLNSFLFSGPISAALEQPGTWNFIVFVLRIYSFSS